MANNVWASTGSVDGNLASNWSLARVPIAGDNILFNNTSSVTCTFTNNITASDFTVAATFVGIINCGSYNFVMSTIANTVVINAGTFNMNSSQWSGISAWTFLVGATVDSGTSQVTFNSSTVTYTYGTKTLYNVVQNNVSNGSTWNTLWCNNFTVLAGSVNGGTFVASGNVSFTNAAGRTLQPVAVTITGNGSLTIANSGTMTANICTLTLQGNNTVILNDTWTIVRLITSTAGKTITWNITASKVLNINNISGGNIGGTLAQPVTWVSSVPGTRYAIVNNQVGGILLQHHLADLGYLTVTDCDNTNGGGAKFSVTSQTNCLGFLTSNIWIASSPSTWNTSANWHLGHIPTVNECAVFDGNSVQNCTVDISPTCDAIITATNYSGNWTMNGQTVTLTNGCLFAGTGTHDFGSEITDNGNTSKLYFAVGLGGVTSTSCVITVNGNSAVLVHDAKGFFFKGLVLGPGAVVSTMFLITPSEGGTALTLGNNSSITLFNNSYVRGTSAVHNYTLWSIGTGVTFNNGNRIDVQNGNITMSAITAIGAGIWNFSYWTTGMSINITGELNFGLGSGIVQFANGGASGAYSVVTNGYNITAGDFRIGGGPTNFWNFSSSNLNVVSFNDQFVYANTITFTTGTITTQTGFILSSYHTYNWGTSVVTITGNCTINNAGCYVYDIVFNGVGKTFILSGNITIAHNYTFTAGTLTAGTNYIIFSGATALITISATTGISSRINTKVNNQVITWNTIGSAGWTIPAYAANDIGGTAGNLVQWVSSSATVPYMVNFSTDNTISYLNVTDCVNNTLFLQTVTNGTDGGRNVMFSFGAALNTWNGTAGNWSDGTKWSLGHKPATGEDIRFTTGTGACTVDEAPNALNSLIFVVGYTGVFNGGAQNFTIYGTCSIVTGYTFTSTGTWTQSYGGNFTINPTSTATVSSMVIDLQGSGTFNIGKISTVIAKLTCAATSRVTICLLADTNSGVQGGSNDLLLMDGGTLTISGTNVFSINTTGTCAPFTQNGTLNGTAGLLIRAQAAGITVTVPAITNSSDTTGGLQLAFQAGDNCIFSITGGLTTVAGSIYIMVANNGTGTGGVVNTNNNTINTGIGTLYVGAWTSTRNITLNFGSSTVSCAAFNGATYSTGPTSLTSTGNWTIAGVVNWTPTHASSTLIASGIWTQTGNANWTFGNAGTYTVSTMSIDLQGTGTLLFAKTLTKVGKLTCAAAGKTTTISASTSTFCGVLAAASNALVIGSGTITISGNLYVDCTATCTPVSQTGTMNGGSGGLYIRSVSAGITITVSALSHTGSNSGLFLAFLSGDSSIISLSGNLTAASTTSIYLVTYASATSDLCTLNTNGYSITTGATGVLYVGSNTASKTLTVNFDDSVVTCGTFNTTSYNTGPCAFNMQTSQWFAAGANWNFGSNTTVDAGSSLVTFSGAGGTYTSGSKTLYDVTVNCTSLNMGAEMICHTLTCTSGNLLGNAATFTISGDFVWNSPGTLTITTAGWTMTGASQAFTINNTGTLTFTALTLTLQGNTAFTLGKDMTVSRLLTKTASKTITWNTGANTLTVSSYTAADWGGTAGNDVVWVSSSPGTQYRVKNNTTSYIIAKFMNVTDAVNTGTYFCSAPTISNTSGWSRLNIWSAAGPSTWNTAGNWSSSAVPTSGDTAYFDNTSVQNCTVDAIISVDMLITLSTYSGNFNAVTYAITSVSTISFSSTGTLLLANVTMTGDGNFTIASTVGAITTTLCNLNLQGTGSLNVTSKIVVFKNVTLAYPSKTTTFSAIFLDTSLVGCSGILTINGGTFTINNDSRDGFNISVTTETNPIVLVTGYTLNGASPLIIRANGANTTFNVPNIVCSSNRFVISTGDSASGNAVITQIGNISCSSVNGIAIGPSAYWGNGTMTYNTGNFAITTTGTFTLGSFSYVANKSLTFNAGSSSIIIGSVLAHIIGPTIYNMGTSVWTCSGNWTFSSHVSTIVNPGTSTVTFNGSANSTLTSAGKTFYNVVVAKAANTYSLTLADALSCNTLVTNSGASGNFTAATYAITSVSTLSFSSTGTLNLGNITITGDGDFYIESTVGTITLANLVLQGTGNLDIRKSQTRFVNLTVAASGKTTTVPSTTALYDGCNGVFTIGAGTFTLNASNFLTNYTHIANNTPLVIDANATINGTGGSWLIWLNTSSIVTWNLPGFTVGGNVTVVIGKQNQSSVLTVNQQGNILVNNSITIGSGWPTTFNTNNFSITHQTAGVFTINTATINFGSSYISTMYFSASGASSRINMQSSTWICIGTWDFGIIASVDAGTAQVTFGGSNHSLIASRNKSFFKVIINKTSAVYNVTLYDNITISGNFTFTAGTLLAATFYIIFTGATPTITLSASISSRIRMATNDQVVSWNTGANTWTIPAYALNDIGGTTGHLVELKSTTPGSQWNISAPAGVIISYTKVTDSVNLGTQIDASNGTNINGGNNILWYFGLLAFAATIYYNMMLSE